MIRGLILQCRDLNKSPSSELLFPLNMNEHLPGMKVSSKLGKKQASLHLGSGMRFQMSEQRSADSTCCLLTLVPRMISLGDVLKILP